MQVLMFIQRMLPSCLIRLILCISLFLTGSCGSTHGFWVSTDDDVLSVSASTRADEWVPLETMEGPSPWSELVFYRYTRFRGTMPVHLRVQTRTKTMVLRRSTKGYMDAEQGVEYEVLPVERVLLDAYVSGVPRRFADDPSAAEAASGSVLIVGKRAVSHPIRKDTLPR